MGTEYGLEKTADDDGCGTKDLETLATCEGTTDDEGSCDLFGVAEADCCMDSINI